MEIYHLLFALYFFIIFFIHFKYPKFSVIAFSTILLIFLPHIIDNVQFIFKNQSLFFILLKLFSLYLSIVIIYFAITYPNKVIFLKLVFAFLILNIAETAAFELYRLESEHILNGLAGLMLIISAWRPLRINSSGTPAYLEYDINANFVISYCLFVTTFIYLNYTYMIFQNLILLGVPLVIFCWNKKLWLQARAYTVFLYIFTRCLASPEVMSVTHYLGQKDMFVAEFLALMSFLWACQMTIYTFYLKNKERIK